MSCNYTFVGIYKDGSDNPLIGICNGLVHGELDLQYYDANTGEEVIIGSDELLTCCSGSFSDRINGMSCNELLIGVFVNTFGYPVLGRFEGIKSGVAIISYYLADTGVIYNGDVEICCNGGGGGGSQNGYFPMGWG